MDIESLRSYDRGDFRKFSGKYVLDKAFHELHGLLRGISLDGKVNDAECAELKVWLECNRHLQEIDLLGAVCTHLEEIVADGRVDEEELQDLLWLTDRLSEWNEAQDLITMSIRTLHGIFHGILSDGVISDDELKALQTWVYDNDFLKGVYPYDELESVIVTVLSDRKVTEEERKLLGAFFADFIDFSKSANLSKEKFDELRAKYTVGGICATDPDVQIEGSTFCFTGTSSRLG